MLRYLSFLALSSALSGGILASRLLLHARALVPGAIALAQDDCPPIDAFALGDHWSVTLSRLPPDQVWPRVRQALGVWRAAHFPEDTSSLPALVLERTAVVQREATPLDARQARTCYFQKHLPPRIEYRLALAFTIRDPEGARGPTRLELRWLSGLRGAGERTWMTDRERVGPLVEDFVRLLTQSK